MREREREDVCARAMREREREREAVCARAMPRGTRLARLVHLYSHNTRAGPEWRHGGKWCKQVVEAESGPTPIEAYGELVE